MAHSLPWESRTRCNNIKSCMFGTAISLEFGQTHPWPHAHRSVQPQTCTEVNVNIHDEQQIEGVVDDVEQSKALAVTTKRQFHRQSQ